MGLNNAAMTVGANAMKAVFGYAQLHYGAAGSSYTSNVSTAARKAITWTAVTGAGDFGLASQIDFTGGEASGPVKVVTIWSTITAGTCYGDFVINDPDAAFNSSGDYSLTSLDLDGSAS